MQYIIGVDIGTTNTKAIAYSTTGKIMATATQSHSTQSSAPGFDEQDPEILFEAVLSCLQDVLQHSYHEGILLGFSFSTAMHGLMAVNKNGKPLTKLMTWADLRSNKYALAIKDTPQGESIYRQSGTPIHPMLPLCKIMWVKDTLPDIFDMTHKFISFKEYLFFNFFGQYVIDHSIACATGLFSIPKKTWNEDALDLAGITQDHLSIPVSTTFMVTGLKKQYAQRLLVDENIPFIIGASDGCLANLGSNAIQEGDLSITIGTSGAARMVSTDPGNRISQGLFNYVLTEDLYVKGGAVNNGGNVLKWYAENFLNRPFRSMADFQWFVDEAMQVTAGSEGLICLPYIFGERSPVWDAEATGVFLGIKAAHRQAHCMRAIIEGISFALYGISNLLEKHHQPIKNIYASGAFTKSKPWMQLMADVFGKRIQVTETTDASAIGAAILGLKGLGIITNISEASLFIEVVEDFFPDEKNHKIYLDTYTVYSSLYERLKDAFTKISTLRLEGRSKSV